MRPSEHLTPEQRDELVELMRSMRHALEGMAQHGLMPLDGFESLEAFRSEVAAQAVALEGRAHRTDLPADEREHAAEGARRFAELSATLTEFANDPLHSAALAVEIASIDGQGGRRSRAEARVRARAILHRATPVIG